MKTLPSVILFTLCVFVAPVVAHAAIDVDFQTTPLFGNSNFLPGDTVTKTVTVTNTGDTTQNVYTELLNVIDGGLSPMVDVAISSGGVLFAGSFDEFDDAGEVFLTPLGSGDTVIYHYAMSFESVAGNDYQNKSLGFDICVGFSGGQFECDDEDREYSQGSYGNYTQGSYNGDGYAEGSYRGGEDISLRDGGGNISENGPIPKVLGEQFNALPFGAPNTGMGGLFSNPENSTKTIAVLFVLLSIVVLTLLRKRMETR